MNLLELLTKKLQTAFPEGKAYVVNPLGDGMHFHCLVVSDRFEGVAPVAAHRMVQSAVAEELAGPVHALGIKVATEEKFKTNQDKYAKYTR